MCSSIAQGAGHFLAQGVQLYRGNKPPLQNGGVAYLQLVGHGICIAVCDLFFLDFNQIRSATLIEIG